MNFKVLQECASSVGRPRHPLAGTCANITLLVQIEPIPSGKGKRIIDKAELPHFHFIRFQEFCQRRMSGVQPSSKYRVWNRSNNKIRESNKYKNGISMGKEECIWDLYQ